jgi:hypothetical protein
VTARLRRKERRGKVESEKKEQKQRTRKIASLQRVMKNQKRPEKRGVWDIAILD